MKTRIILIAAILGSMVGGGIAIADAVNTDTEPFVAEPMPEMPKEPTIEERQKLADAYHGRIEAFSEESGGLTPLSGYQNERGETTAYVRTADIGDPNRTRYLDVITLKGTKVGELGPTNETRPDPEEVNRIAAEEADK